MIKNIIILTTICIMIALFTNIFSEAKEMKQSNIPDKDLIFPTGEKASNEYFTGNAWVEMLVTDVKNYDSLVYNVTFEPGARNFWHKHSNGQILLVTHGEGYYQEKGKPAQLLKKGDTILIPANVEHWHGATADNSFIHLGITPKAQDNQVEWLAPVTDKEYNEL